MKELARDCAFVAFAAVGGAMALDAVFDKKDEPTPQLGIGLSSTNDYFEVKVRSGEHAASVVFRLNVREFTAVEVTNYIDRTFAPQGWVPLPGVPGTWISTVGDLIREPAVAEHKPTAATGDNISSWTVTGLKTNYFEAPEGFRKVKDIHGDEVIVPACPEVKLFPGSLFHTNRLSGNPFLNAIP